MGGRRGGRILTFIRAAAREQRVAYGAGIGSYPDDVAIHHDWIAPSAISSWLKVSIEIVRYPLP